MNNAFLLVNLLLFIAKKLFHLVPSWYHLEF